MLLEDTIRKIEFLIQENKNNSGIKKGLELAKEVVVKRNKNIQLADSMPVGGKEINVNIDLGNIEEITRLVVDGNNRQELEKKDLEIQSLQLTVKRMESESKEKIFKPDAILKLIKDLRQEKCNEDFILKVVTGYVHDTKPLGSTY